MIHVVVSVVIYYRMLLLLQTLIRSIKTISGLLVFRAAFHILLFNDDVTTVGLL